MPAMAKEPFVPLLSFDIKLTEDHNMKYNLPWLLAEIEEGIEPSYLFFWGDKSRKDGAIGKSCLSQWWKQGFTHEEIYYRTAEHWMMAEKARLFGDEESLKKILRSNTPIEAKKLGRKVRDFQVEIWTQHCYDIVRTGNWYKFSQHPRLKAFLLSTGQQILVEASPYDQIWGIGLSQEAPQAHQPSEWLGQNLLGFALMEVRDELQ